MIHRTKAKLGESQSRQLVQISKQRLKVQRYTKQGRGQKKKVKQITGDQAGGSEEHWCTEDGEGREAQT